MNRRPAGGDRVLQQLSARQVAEALGLEPHREGGFFRETYRAAAMVQTTTGPRSLVTSILYLLTTGSPSRFHRLASDELWFYHAGAPAELWLLGPDREVAAAEGPAAEAAPGKAPAGDTPVAEVPADGTRRLSGAATREVLDLENPCVVVPARRWMGARVIPRGKGEITAGWTLVTCVVTPGFEYEDFDAAERETLLREFPQAWREILALT